MRSGRTERHSSSSSPPYRSRTQKSLTKTPNGLTSGTRRGSISDARHKELQAIVEKARAGDWGEAERLAYAFREAQPFFK